MPNKIQIKRTTVSGRTPNTTDPANTRYIDSGELSLNLTDGKLFSSNGLVYFEVGANLQFLSLSGFVATLFLDESTSSVSLSGVGQYSTNSDVPSGGSDASLFFPSNSTGNRVVVGPDTDLGSIGTGDFTVECWFKVPSGTTQTNFATIFNTASNVFALQTNFSGTAGFHCRFNSGSPNLNYNASIVDSVWHHMAVTRSGTTLTLWCDGVSQDTDTSSASVNFGSSSESWIGAGTNGASDNPYKGYVYKLRISNVARYSATFTPSSTYGTDGNTIFLLKNNLDVNARINVGSNVFVNTSALSIGPFGTTNGALLTATTFDLGNTTANSALRHNIIYVANSTGRTNVNPTFIVTPTVNATSNLNVGTFGTTNGVNIVNTAIVVGNSTTNATLSFNLIRVANSTSTANLTPTTLAIGSITVNSALANLQALNVVNQTNTATLFVTTSANVASAFLANSTGAYHTGTVNAASHTVGTTTVVNSTAISLGPFGTTNGTFITTTSVDVGNSTANAAVDYNIIYVANSTGRANLTPTALAIGSITVNSALANLQALNVVNQTNTATLYVTTSANVGTAFTVNSTVLTSTGNANFDSGTLFVDSVNNRVFVNATSSSLTLTGAFHTVTSPGTDHGLATYAGTHSFRIYPNLNAGSYNNLTAAGDSGIIFSNGTIGFGNLIIGSWFDGLFGIKLNSSANSITIAGNAVNVTTSLTVGSASLTSALANLQALNVVNQTNTATLYVTTSANVGTAAVINSVGITHTGFANITGAVNAASHTVGTTTVVNSTAISLGPFGVTNGALITTTSIDVGNSTANAALDHNIIYVANSTGRTNVNPTFIVTPTVNATSNLNIGTFGVTNGVNIVNTAIVVGNSTANATVSTNLIRTANSTGTSNINPTFIVTPTVNATSNLNVGTFGVTNGVNITNTTIVVGNSIANATLSFNLLQASNSTSTANLTPTTLAIGSITVNSALANLQALNVVNQTNTGTLFVTTSANVGTAFTANSTLVNAVALNVVNQTNTTTLYVTTSANVGTAAVINSIGITHTGFANVTGAVNAASHTVGTSLIANSSGVTHTGFVNAATSVNSALLSVGTSATVNSTLANLAALNVVNQTNTATLFVTTSANVGTAFTANSTLVNAVALNVVNQTNTGTLFVTTSANVGTVFTVNSTLVNVMSSALTANTTLVTTGATTNVNMDSGVLFVDATNNRVGINNTTPGVALRVTGATDISSTANIQGNANVGGTLGVAGVLSASANVNFDAGVLFVDGVNNRVGINNTTPGVALRVTGATDISSTANIQGNANVGGTLGVAGAGNVGGNFGVTGNIIATGSIDCGSQFLGLVTDTVSAPSFSFTGNTNLGIYTPGTNILAITVNGVERFRVNTTVVSVNNNLDIPTGISIVGNTNAQGARTIRAYTGSASGGASGDIIYEY